TGQQLANVWRLIRTNTNTMTNEQRKKPVSKAILGCCSPNSVCRIDVGPTRTHLRDPGLQARVNGGVNLLLAVGRFSADCGTSYVTEIARPRTTNVYEDQVTTTNDLLAA